MPVSSPGSPNEQDPASRASPPPDRQHPLRDRAIRCLGVPLFGVVIPRVAGQFDHLSPGDPAYWPSTAWFILLSFVVWQGNRALHYQLRQRIDRMQRPVLKFIALIAANVGFTIPVSGGMFLLWYRFGPAPAVDWPALARGVGLTAAAVLFVSHAYETVFLLHERRDDRLRMALAERARWQAELDTLKGQLAPHFLFNCLNTLSVLIAEEPRTARKFNQRLANLCRYLLKHKDHNLVSLDEELVFFDEYVELARLRHLDALVVTFRGFDDTRGLQLPPATLQLLLENALKHNACSPADPLPVELSLVADSLVFSNPIRTPPASTDSTGIGLRNIRDRFALLAGRPISVTRDAGVFRVTLPLVRSAKP